MFSSVDGANRDVIFFHGWGAAGPDEPPPSWLSAIWRFIKVRGSRHACVNCGFFDFMDSLISQGSLGPAQISVLTNAAPHNVFHVAPSPPAVHDWMRYMINKEGSHHINQMCFSGCSSLHYQREGSLPRVCDHWQAFQCDLGGVALNIKFTDEKWRAARHCSQEMLSRTPYYSKSQDEVTFKRHLLEKMWNFQWSWASFRANNKPWWGKDQSLPHINEQAPE